MRWKWVVPFVHLEMVVIVFFMLHLAYKSMSNDGVITIDFNRYGEGWPEVVMLATLLTLGVVLFPVMVHVFWDDK